MQDLRFVQVRECNHIIILPLGLFYLRQGIIGQFHPLILSLSWCIIRRSGWSVEARTGDDGGGFVEGKGGEKITSLSLSRDLVLILRINVSSNPSFELFNGRFGGGY